MILISQGGVAYAIPPFFSGMDRPRLNAHGKASSCKSWCKQLQGLMQAVASAGASVCKGYSLGLPKL